MNKIQSLIKKLILSANFFRFPRTKASKSYSKVCTDVSVNINTNGQINRQGYVNSKVFIPVSVQLTSITDVARSQSVTWTYSDVTIDIPISLAYMHGGCARSGW